MKITIPISVGELLDKISILQIKSQFTDNPYVAKEKEHLINIAEEYNVYEQESLNQLLDVNSKLWAIEDKLRKLEKNNEFGEEFIYNARMVYITNDYRAKIKKDINEKYNSEYKEVKCYEGI